MILTEFEKSLLTENKDLLMKNDLITFYNKLEANNNVGYRTIAKISEFLDSNGVEFEKYMDEVPVWFSYAPKNWIHFGDRLKIPGNMKIINPFAFCEVQGIDFLAAYGVEDIGYSFLMHSSITTLQLGPALKRIDGEAFEDSALETLLIPKSIAESYLYNNIERALKDVPFCEVKTF